MSYFLLTSLLLLLTAYDVTSHLAGGFRSPAGSSPSSTCLRHCFRGYIPGTCFCQPPTTNFNLSRFHRQRCRFEDCSGRRRRVCEMRNWRIVCTEVASTEPSENVCNLPAVTGPCRALKTRYFFDKTDGTCKTFNYGGCRGNSNNFHSKPDCESKCIANVPLPETIHPSTGQGQHVEALPVTMGQMCHLPRSTGPCKAYFPSYFFNTATRKCERFVYGGCQGNDNRFSSLGACTAACESHVSGKRESRLLSSNSDCNLPPVTGRCRASIPSFYYNYNTGKCDSFTFGGCGGNANRFRRLRQCQRKCQR